jgi:3'(2'), 5'-bisphosphate nucleotidase
MIEKLLTKIRELTPFSDAISHCFSAGELLMRFYNSELTVNSKEDRTPVTEADLASHELLVRGLARSYPFPILSEEDPVEYSRRSQWTKFWLIDPLDGTKDFIRGSREFCINVALVESGVPVFGLIYGPVENVLYIASKGLGAWKVSSREVKQLWCLDNQVARAAISRYYQSNRTNNLIKAIPGCETVTCGSALKFGLIAEGRASLYPRYGLTSEWDTAAGQIILQEAGGIVVAMDTGTPLQYNKESLLNPDFIAGVSEHVTAALKFA